MVLADTKDGLQDGASAITDQLDLESFVDKTPVGKKVYVEVIDPNVRITFYGSNNVLNSPITSNIPPSATITNPNISIGNYPGVEYKDLQAQDGINVVTEGLAVGSPQLMSMNANLVSVPEKETVNVATCD